MDIFKFGFFCKGARIDALKEQWPIFKARFRASAVDIWEISCASRGTTGSLHRASLPGLVFSLEWGH